MKLNILIISLLFFSSITCGQSQTISSKIIDGKTKKPIPYVTIQYGENQGVISNEEGRFSFVIDSTTQKLDSIYISSIGYEKIGFDYEAVLDSIIYIQPKAIELGGVYVFDKNLTVSEILDKVENNIEKNHGETYLKKRFFLRQAYYDRLTKVKVDFKKSSIAELDKELIDSTIAVIPRQSSYFTETLGELYLSGSEEIENKVHIIKAAELYDKNNEISGEALQERFEKILQENVKQDSYLKIKSGWFSTKIQVDSILEGNEESQLSEEEKAPERSNFLPNRKRTLSVMHDRMWSKKTSLDVIKKLNRYEFDLKGYGEVQEQGVYILDFEPKRRADFAGKLYINIEDFAIMRVDYENVKLLRNFNLLGISFKSHTYKGSTVFTKTLNGPYTLKFATFTYGSTGGVDRPLKIVEKNKNVRGRRKQNELKLNIDVANSSSQKYELVVYDIQASNAGALNSFKEDKTVKPTYLPAYDPEFWKGFNIMEPNQAIREFTVSETD